LKASSSIFFIVLLLDEESINSSIVFLNSYSSWCWNMRLSY